MKSNYDLVYTRRKPTDQYMKDYAFLQSHRAMNIPKFYKI